MQKVEGSSPFSRSSEVPAKLAQLINEECVEAATAGLFRLAPVSRRNPALGEHAGRLGEVAAHHALEQRDGVIGVVDVLLIDIRGRVPFAPEIGLVLGALVGRRSSAPRRTDR